MIADTKINTYILKRGTTGNDLKQPKQLQQPRNNLRVPQFHRTPLLKKKSIGGLQYHKEAIDKFHIRNISYHLVIYEMIAGRSNIKSNQTSQLNKAK